MGTENRRTSCDLDELYLHGYKFSLFQAVRLLQRNHPESLGVGLFGRSTEEVVRFCGHNSLVFPSGVIHSINKHHPYGANSRNQSQAQVEVSALGLAGYAGVLPAFYTERITRTHLRGQTNSALASFLDLFNHRLVSLLYRCWERARPHIACERYCGSAPFNDSFSQHLFALLGLGTTSVRGSSPVEPHVMIRYAGLLPYRSSASLEAILADHFGLNFEVEQFRGRWCTLSDTDRARLSTKHNDTQLGIGAMLGRVTWYPQASFRIRVRAIRQVAHEFSSIAVPEPLGFNEFCRLLPGTAGFERLLGMINYFTCERFETFGIELTLKAKDIPLLQLGCNGGDSVRLGWTSWLGGRVDRDSVAIVFGTGEAITRVRIAVTGALRGIRGSLSRLRQLELCWNDEVVDEIMARWKGSRMPARDYSKMTASNIMREIARGIDEAHAEKRTIQKATILASQQGLSYRID